MNGSKCPRKMILNDGRVYSKVCDVALVYIQVKRVYYSLAVWRFKLILNAGLRFHSHLSGGLRLRNYRAVAGNHKFSSRFSVLRVFVAIIRWLLNGVVETIKILWSL